MVSKVGVFLVVIGMVIFGVAYAFPSLAVINLQTEDTGMNVVGVVPTSTSASSPTTLISSEQLYITFTTDVNPAFSEAPTITNPGGTLTVAGVGISTTVASSSFMVVALKGYEVKLEVLATFTPSSNQLGTVMTFVWTGSVTVNGALFAGTATTYGEYAQPLAGLGEFGISANNYPFQYITPSTNLTMQFSSFPQPITFYYVENNGATVGASEIYVTESGTNLVLWSAANGGTKTTVNGFTAYTFTESLQPGTYTINGYVTNATSGSPIQLMSLFANIPLTQPALTLNQMVSMALGALMMVVGVVMIVRRFP